MSTRQPYRLIIVPAFLVVFGAAPFSAFSWPVPDTGQAKCYADLGAEISCEGAGQDGTFIIDRPSYTKLDANGEPLPDSATSWVMVEDNVTGLIWEVKQNKDGTPDNDNPHDADNTYTWYDPNDDLPGTQGDGIDTFDTLQFIDALNTANFGGMGNNWRMPTLNEMRSIMDYNVLENLLDPKPTINTAYFAGTLPTEYWLSESIAFSTDSAWFFSFLLGHSGSVEKTSTLYVRAVCNGRSTRFGELISNGNGTVIDARTGLMWEKKTDDGGLRDKDHLYTISEALDYCETLDLGGYSDWRLPTVKELESIVNPDEYDPSINREHFPNTAWTFYASSTTDLNMPFSSWCVHFGHGDASSSLKTLKNFAVRAVRGGQPEIQGRLLILKPARASFLQAGSDILVTWNTADIPGYVKIAISYEGGKPGTYQTIAASAPNTGEYLWTVPDIPSFKCMLKIEPLSEPTKSTVQGLFTIDRFIAANPLDLVLDEPASPSVAGEAKTFELSMPAPPSGDAVFNLYSSNPTECTVSPDSVTLDAGNYATGATITVTSTYDGVRDGEQRAFVLITTADANAGFYAYEAPILPVTVRDAQTGVTLTSVYPAYLQANQSAAVTLRGHGFSTATRVYIYPEGVIPIEITPVTVIDDTTLIVTLPGQTAGSYHLKVDSSELENAVTFAASLATQSRKKAIIVAGGGPRADNSLWNAAEKCTRNAYRTLTFQGYSADSIKFFSSRLWDDITGDGVNDIDGDATLANLQAALTSWATTGTDDVSLYIIGESGNKTIRLGSAASDILSAAALDGWLDTLQTKIAGPVAVILDACLAGSFLQPLADADRIVIASTLASERAWFLNDGELSFSHRLFDRLFFNPDLYGAFTAAEELTGDVQTPVIDIDGDGLPNDLANKHTPVGGFELSDKIAAEKTPPSVGWAWIEPADLPEEVTKAIIYASEVTPAGFVETVWAEITPPGFAYVPPNIPGIAKPARRLTDFDLDGTYEDEYNAFNWQGTYTITVYAVDKNDYESHRVPLFFNQEDGILPGLGDMNGDLRVSMADVIYVLRIMTGEPLSPPPTADYDHDGKTELADAVFILQMVAEIRE